MTCILEISTANSKQFFLGKISAFINIRIVGLLNENRELQRMGEYHYQMIAQTVDWIIGHKVHGCKNNNLNVT